jgi:hypothetical protein
MDSQVPIGGGEFDFYEVNSRVYFQPFKRFEFGIGHRFLSDHPFFRDSNQVDFSLYSAITENWGISSYTRYEFEDSTIDYQRISLHRDLASWTASIGGIVRQTGLGDEEYGIILSLTLKEFPQVNIPVDFNPSSGGASEN